MLYCTVAAPEKVVLSGFSLVLLMYIIDEAEEKGSVQWSTISYQKANLNLPHHDQPDFRATGVTRQHAQPSLQAALNL